MIQINHAGGVKLLYALMKVLVLYSSIEGQTERIAQRVAHLLREAGHAVRLQRAGEALELSEFDAIVVGASVHYGHHPDSLAAQLRREHDRLAGKPGAFFSVSLSAGGPRPKPAAARRYIERFLRRSRWRPERAVSFAGALVYSQYGWFKKLVVLCFVALGGGDTDTSRDYEYTDYEAVADFARGFAQTLARRSAKA